MKVAATSVQTRTRPSSIAKRLFIVAIYCVAPLLFTSCLEEGLVGQDPSSGNTGQPPPPPDVTGIAAIVDSTTGITVSWTSGGGTTAGFQMSY